MGKIVMWLVAAIAGFLFYKAVKARKNADENSNNSRGMEDQNADKSQLDGKSKTEAMVLCGVCGVHLPASESMTVNKVISCSTQNACSNKRS